MTTATQPVFVSDSKNTIFTNTLDLRVTLQKRLIALSGTKRLCDQAREDIVKRIVSNLIERIGSLDQREISVRKKILNLPAHQREKGATGRTIIEELVDRCLVLEIDGDRFGSSTCLLVKEDLEILGITFAALDIIRGLNSDWFGGPNVTWGFCNHDKDGKSETEPYIWVGFAFGTKVS